MPSEKAKENKLLTAECTACGKTVSVEVMTGTLVGRGPHRHTVPVCDECRVKGWEPPEAAAS